MGKKLTKEYASRAGRQHEMTKEQREEYKQLAAALNEEARENWENPMWRRDVAAQLAAVLDYGFEFDSTFNRFFDTEAVDEFEKIYIERRKGLKAFWTALGGYIDESQITNEKWELPRDEIGFHYRESDDKLRANFAESLADISTLGAMRLNAEIYKRVFATLQAAIPSNSPYYQSGAGIAQTDLNAALREVKDEVRPDGSGPATYTIVGRATVTDQILDFTGAIQNDYVAQEEIRHLGTLTRYRGADVITLEHFQDEDGVDFLPSNELWVFAGQVGKIGLYGGTRSRFWQEDNVEYSHMTSRRNAGVMTYQSNLARRIVDTSLAG